MVPDTIITENAASPIGPYSQGTIGAGLIFTAGQIGVRTDGSVVDGGVAEQTRQVILNLKAVIEAGGGSLQSVLKTTIFLKNMNDFASVNEVYGEYFGTRSPARSTVEVSRLPKDVLVEIEAVALVL
jgi:2-iminobutanoate/2-iminopropanoate deaminase